MPPPRPSFGTPDCSAGHYDHDAWVWANVVAPRFDVELGLPPLSSHLMVDIGASFRLAVAHSTGMSTDEFGQTRADFRYRAPWDDKADPYRSLELSLSLKYVP